MIKTPFTYAKHLISPLALTLLLPMSTARGELGKLDPFEYCTNTCVSPGPCETANIADDCKKFCKDEGVWKHVASLHMSKTNAEYRTSKDPHTREKMLFKSPIAKCLGLTMPEDRPLKPSSLPTSTKDEVCAAAIKKEMSDLGHDQIALKTQEETLAAVLKSLQPSPAATAG